MAVEKKEKRKRSERGKDLEEGKQRRAVMTTFIDCVNFQSHLVEASLFGIKEKEKRKCFEGGKDSEDG